MTDVNEDLSINICVSQGVFELKAKLDMAASRHEVLDCVDNLLNALYGEEKND